MRTGAKHEEYLDGVRVSYYDVDDQVCVYGGDAISAMNIVLKDPHKSRNIRRKLTEHEDYEFRKYGTKYERAYLTKKGVQHLYELSKDEVGENAEKNKDHIIATIIKLEKGTVIPTTKDTDSYLVDLMEDIDRRLCNLEDTVNSMDMTQDLLLKMVSAYQAETKITICQGISVLCDGISNLPFQKSKAVKAMLQGLSVQFHKEAKRSGKFLSKIEKDGALDGIWGEDKEDSADNGSDSRDSEKKGSNKR